MRKLFLALSIVSMGLFSSCDKCKDKTCENSASCDKKTADCSNVCVNGGTSNSSDGSCACAEYYNGGTCSKEVRSDYVGTYIGNFTDIGSGEVDIDTMVVELSGTDVKMLVLKAYGYEDDPDVTLELTTNTAFKFSYSIPDNGDVLKVVGTGTFSRTSMNMETVVSGFIDGQAITFTEKFDGIK